MGDESGEALDRIVQRKDLERRAAGGLFVWGIGNGLGKAIRDLVNSEPEPRVLFSPIRSAATTIDRNPTGVLLWLHYVGPSGQPTPLPEASFVTSRDSTANGSAKAAHYALFCRSDDPLATKDLGTVRFAELRNLTTQRPVGFSQVTAVVSRSVRAEGRDLEYPVVLSAHLAAPHFGRLATPVALHPEDSKRVDTLAELGDPDLWLSEIKQIKQRYSHGVAFNHVAADIVSLFASVS